MELPNFDQTLLESVPGALRRAAVSTLQVNVGRRCDLACHHCHVEAGPKRTETMDERTAERVLALLERNPHVTSLDLTGGAPELNAQFRRLVRGGHALGRRIIDRCNLTVFFQPGQEDTPKFLAEHAVKIVASLPCYTKDNVEKQRGKHVFDRSIRALRLLKGLGYGMPGSALELDLVYNPLGPSLPPDQDELTNMPIKRFAHALARDGQHEAYMCLLANHFNPQTIPALMCRHLVSVGYDGRLFDCDFNQMLELPLGGHPRTIWQVEDLSSLEDERIATDVHCYGCTAGSGSSCGGTLT